MSDTKGVGFTPQHHGMKAEDALRSAVAGARSEAPGSTMGERSVPSGGPADTTPLRGKSYSGIKPDAASPFDAARAAGEKSNPSFAGTPVQGPSAPTVAPPSSIADENSPFDAARKAAAKIKPQPGLPRPSDNMAPDSERR